jgi:hypothetical protein
MITVKHQEEYKPMRWESRLYYLCSEVLLSPPHFPRLFDRLSDSELVRPFTVSRTFLILSRVMPSLGCRYRLLKTVIYPELSCHAP